MPFLTLNNNASNLAEYYNNITSTGVFAGTIQNPNVTSTTKPEIPPNEELFLSFDDGFIRGGLSNAILASTKDTVRIGKFITGLSSINRIDDFKDTSFQSAASGILFLTKQAGLQLLNPRLEWDRDNAVPPLLGGPNRQFTGAGLIESVAGNAFGLHFDRAGLLGIIRDDQKYDSITYKNNFGENNNNLKITEYSHNRLLRYLNEINNTDDNSVELDRYLGGPGSIYGVIGRTTVRSYSDRTIISDSDLGVFYQTSDVYSLGADLSLTSPVTFDITTLGFKTQIGPVQNVTSVTKAVDKNPKLNGFIPLTNKALADNPNSLPNSNFYPNQNTLDNSLFYNKSSKTVSRPGYDIESKYGVSTPVNIDSINSIKIIGSDVFYGNSGNSSNAVADAYSTGNLSKVQGDFGEDLIKFRIEFLNNEKSTTLINKKISTNTDILAFRAYIDAFDDGMQAKWNSYRYMGRGEEFYVYEGFSRDISVSFTIHAHSENEMAPLYSKLNYLMSSFTPDYSSTFKMRGNIGYLTVGDYLYRQPGIFTDIKIGGMLEGSWETGVDNLGNPNGQYQVPRMLKIGLSFKPIHTFLPRRNYSSKGASGAVNQTSPAPFITPDRVAYPTLDPKGNPNKTNNYLSF